MKTISTIGIDLAKNSLHLFAVDEHGKKQISRKMTKTKLFQFLSNTKPCLIGLEACAGSHYVARRIKELGHEVKLMAPQYVRPYVKTNKNDAADAEAICEAVTRPNMRFVAIKNRNHLDLQAIHRLREQQIKLRTSMVNCIRGLLMEHGITINKGIRNVKPALLELLRSDDHELSELFVEILQRHYQAILRLDEAVEYYDKKIEDLSRSSEGIKRLKNIPGVGPIIASAFFSTVVDFSIFKNGRHFAAWLGLVPRQHSTGGRTVLLGISKRGDGYLRKLLVHGARASLRWADKRSENDRLARWGLKVQSRVGVTSKTIVAMANKMARIIWAMMTKELDYIPAGI